MPLIASTECPNPTNMITSVNWLSLLPKSQPIDSLLIGITPGCNGFGGQWMPTLNTVSVAQISRSTTITVVTIMICKAVSLDACRHSVFFRQTYRLINDANPVDQ